MSDIREIFDRSAEWDAKRQRARRLAGLLREHLKLTTRPECGDCSKWMKSRSCPRERNVNGRNVGPSMGASACAEFAEKDSSAERRRGIEREIASLSVEEKA